MESILIQVLVQQGVPLEVAKTVAPMMLSQNLKPKQQATVNRIFELLQQQNAWHAKPKSRAKSA